LFFRDIIGQNDVKEQLINSAKKGIIPHAQLFCGQEGVGKFPLALAYAQYLNCEDPSETDSCGKCPSCVKYNHLVHPDLHFVFPIVKKAAKKKKEVCDDYITEWREFIRQSCYFSFSRWLGYIDVENSQGLIYSKESEEIIRKLSLRIYEARYKVMIIWLPEKMHESCANKLLKIIEEPTDNTIFLLVSNMPDHIITTIQSRCQRINIHGVEEKEMARALEAACNITPEDAASVSRLANGSYLKAMETISLNEELKMFFNLFVRMMRASYARNIKEIKTASNEIAGVGRENQKGFLQYSQRLIREYFASNFNQAKMVYLTQDEAGFGMRFAPFINERNIIGFMNELALAEQHIEQNVNAKMVFFDLCLKITMLIKQ
jgi:DNA polymerase-3 subunit delta'